VEGAQGNPVILYFLEHDIREMKRLTQGSQNYFRKRIRMSIFQGATLKPGVPALSGARGAGQEIAITPYVDDPNRFRYEKLAGKGVPFHAGGHRARRGSTASARKSAAAALR